MLKFKNEKKEFTIVYNAEDCTDNKVYDYVVSEEGVNLIMDNSDVFVMDSNTDIDEWNEQFIVEDIDDPRYHLAANPEKFTKPLSEYKL